MSLSLLIILHELGHFIPAKIFKTKVEKFYLFFDWPFSLIKKKFGETEYGIGLLPLGGYVKIAGMIDESMDKEQLKKEPEDWEPREQLLFKASEFGDDTDRPLQKSDGTWTYFAADVAYHLDKLERTRGPLINIFGADHGGYVKRMTAAVTALSGMQNMLDIKLCQLVNLLDNGQPVKMSKRAGTFVTVEDVIEAVGADVIRFIMLTRRNDQTLDFDFAKVTEQSRDNPVFYVQYAHARACSVIRQFEKDRTIPETANLDLITDPAELAVVKMLVGWPKLVESAASAHEPHRIAFYLVDLASRFHSLWNAGRETPSLRFILDDDEAKTAARMQLVQATSFVIRTGLNVLSIKALEEM